MSEIIPVLHPFNDYSGVS